jgi:hypothetical protein
MKSLYMRSPVLVLAGVLSMALLCRSTAIVEAQNPVKYACRWDKVAGAGGAWSTGWVPGHVSPYCGASAVNRVCPAGNFSAAQPSGAQISYWPQGCAGPQWTIQCTCKAG